MEIKIYCSYTEEIILDVFRFSYLMTDGGEIKEAVYSTILNLLQSSNGCFFSVKNKGNKIAYGLFSYGLDDRKFRRLYYFAVERELRCAGLGESALKLALGAEVNIDHGCTVACKPGLRHFYEKVGFEYSASAKDKEIVLAYFNPKRMNIEQCVNKKIWQVKVELDAVKAFAEMESALSEHGVMPP